MSTSIKEPEEPPRTYLPAAMMSVRPWLKRLGFGRLVYGLWYAPIGAVRTSIAAGGPIEQWRDRQAHAVMAAGAAQLSLQDLPVATGWPEIHFLTGAKFWDQTALCLYSLQRHAGQTLPAVFHDDGSATDTIVDRLGRLFPCARWRRRDEIVAMHDQHLPVARFPVLRERWAAYPNIRKLTDVHVGSRGWKLVLDSDMLFFRRPDFLLAWLAAPTRPLHMVDVEQSYGYSPALMQSLAGAPIPSLVNVGITGLASESLDWDRLERWCRELIAAEGPSYYLEQALIAMLVAGQDRAVAPAADYIVLPNIVECQSPRAVLHHYVAGSKRGYFRHAWRKI
jgi:hypothetical protein